MASNPRFTTLPTDAQQRYLRRGIDQPGGKLPLFDEDGKQINAKTIRSCVELGWARPWFENPIKSDWLVCRLTERGRDIVEFKRKRLNNVD